MSRRLLRHLGLPDEVLAARPPRAPPQADSSDDASAPGRMDSDW